MIYFPPAVAPATSNGATNSDPTEISEASSEQQDEVEPGEEE